MLPSSPVAIGAPDDWRERADVFHAAVARGRHPTSFTRRDNALWQFVSTSEQLRKEVQSGHTLWKSATAAALGSPTG